MHPYRKLYFIWFFDDDEGYGIEVLGERQKTNTSPATEECSKFYTVVNWTFGLGTKARDLRRTWGDFTANLVAENQGIMPPEIEKIVLHFNVQEQVLEGDLDKIEKRLKML